MRLLRLVILLAAVAIVVFPAGLALGQEGANATRVLPDTVERGGTFNVTVTFTADGDNFTSITLYDHPPAGWNVTTNKTWCTPNATYAPPAANMTDLAWTGIYDNGTNFKVVYQVTVPSGAELGDYSFYGYHSLAFYSDKYYDEGEPYHEWQNVTGYGGCLYCNVTVIPPAICFTPASIDFYAPLGQNPENQTLQLWSSTPCMINWSLSDDSDYAGHDWLSENSTSGNCTNVTSSVTLSVNTSVNSSSMPVGDYTANITIEAPYPEANNSPRIVPVSLHIRTTGTLKGQVNFIGRGDPGTDRWVEPFVVKFFDNATKLEMGWPPINATTDAYGNFTIEDIAVGTYDIGIKNRTCLSEMVTNVTLNVGALTVVDFGTIREGDVKESDKADGFDLALLSSAYNTRPGDGNWNANADLNRSGKVDGFDLALLSSNYNARGDAYGYF